MHRDFFRLTWPSLRIMAADGGTMIVVSLPIPEPESVRSSAQIA
jgi:hypothetical protein